MKKNQTRKLTLSRLFILLWFVQALTLSFCFTELQRGVFCTCKFTLSRLFTLISIAQALTWSFYFTELQYIWDVIVCTLTSTTMEWDRTKINAFPLNEDTEAEAMPQNTTSDSVGTDARHNTPDVV